MILPGLRLTIRTARDRFRTQWKKRASQAPRLFAFYSILSWLGLALLCLSLPFMKDSRTLLVQALASFYVLWQLWIVCRSKTVGWSAYAAFFIIGTWIVAPLNTLFIQLVFLPFDPAVYAVWNASLVSPLTEELMKLAPLLLFLWGSRKATSLSLADFALIGGATGAGLQFLEEYWMRLHASLEPAGSAAVSPDSAMSWNLFHFLPSLEQGLASPWAGHTAATALCALGLGIAIRLRRVIGKAAYALPVFLLVWVAADHAVHNGTQATWLNGFHMTLGGGAYTKALFIVLLIGAVAYDYADLNRMRKGLTLFRSENLIEPFRELYRSLSMLQEGAKRYVSLLRFYRIRRRLAFTLLYGKKDAKRSLGNLQDEMKTLNKAAVPVLLAAGFLLLSAAAWTGGLAAAAGSSPAGSACVSCLYAPTSAWWSGQSAAAKGVLLLGTAFLFTSFFPLWGAVSDTLAGDFKARRKHAGRLQPGEILPLLGAFTPRMAAAAGLQRLLDRLAGLGAGKKPSAPSAESASSGAQEQPSAAQSAEAPSAAESAADAGSGADDTADAPGAAGAARSGTVPERRHRFTTARTRQTVHQGKQAYLPAGTLYGGGWTIMGLHNWNGFLDAVRRDRCTVVRTEELPENGIRRAVIRRQGTDPLTGETFTSLTYGKTFYPKHYNDSEIDRLGEDALNKAILHNRLQSQNDHRGRLQAYTFREEVVGPDGKIIGVQGRVLPDAEGNLTEIIDHFPYNHRQTVSFRRLSADQD
ncbi:PrsW family glutamic-type intramembrane protease [Paenibacillus chitinolyticus]|uniref:PrsW family glutamic-type intramembrane protease n=1 Tax=Paenibacillus chitinolyticus TaxID=79263 RepID=UPI00366E3EB5